MDEEWGCCLRLSDTQVVFFWGFLPSSCSRLGLVSLSYLWQRDQTELLGEMINNGVKAIVIKVASMGE